LKHKIKKSIGENTNYHAPDPQPGCLNGCASPQNVPRNAGQGDEHEDASVRPTTDEAEIEPVPVPEPELVREHEQELEQMIADTGWLEEKSLLMQNIAADSCEKPLTPVDEDFLVGLPLQSELTEAGIFEEQQFSYNSYCYMDVLLAHAKVYTFALYHLLITLYNSESHNSCPDRLNESCSSARIRQWRSSVCTTVVPPPGKQ
jgi:hypothetical protein